MRVVVVVVVVVVAGGGGGGEAFFYGFWFGYYEKRGWDFGGGGYDGVFCGSGDGDSRGEEREGG